MIYINGKGEKMKKAHRILLMVTSLLLSLLFVVYLITQTHFLNYHQLDGFRNRMYKVYNTYQAEKESSNAYISDISYRFNESGYYDFYIDLIDIDLNDVVSLKIDDVSVTSLSIVDNSLHFTLDESFIDELQKDVSISKIELTDQTLNTRFKFTLFKELDYELIKEKQKSIVGISNNFGWGSGIIIDKEEIIAKNLLNKDIVAYEYTILTAYHVVKSSTTSIRIHYGDTNRTYSQVKFLGAYTTNADLAFLKLTTTDSTLHVLNDEQLINDTATTYNIDDYVFLIGSPKDKLIHFNKITTGHILELDVAIKLKKELKLCRDGCTSIKSTASLFSGSSGGALFSHDGVLLGVHFAGDDYDNGYAIPIETILLAKEKLLTDKTTYLYKEKTPFSRWCFFSLI